MLGISPSHSISHTRVVTLSLSLLLASMLVPGQASALCFNTGQFQAQTLCWNPVSPVPDAFDIEHVVWNPDGPEYLAVGGGGAILASPNGIDWTPRDSGTVQNLYGGLWDGSRYVLVGDGGLVLTSPDGVAWTSRVTNTRLRLLDIASNGNATRYVAVGERGIVLTSTDAENWSSTTVLSLSRRPVLYAVAWHNNRFVAVGSSTTIISSTDGVDWIEHNYTPIAAGQPLPPILRDIAVSATGVFVAVGSSGTVFTSSNGTDWAEAPQIQGHLNARLRGVVRAGNRFLAVGDDGAADEPLLLASTTGQDWSVPGNLPVNIGLETLKTIAYNGSDTLVTGGNRHLLRALAADLDWEPTTSDPGLVSTLNDLQLADFPSPLYLAAGADGTVLSSADGLDWAAGNSGTNDTLNRLAVGDSGIATRVVAVGDNATILYSDDGEVWQAADITQETSANLSGVTFGNELFVAVGAGGTIVSSTDGAVWNLVDAGFAMDLHDVAFALVGDSPLYVAVGAGGAVLTSVNGAGWTLQESKTNGALNAVLWNADDQDPLFVAVGQTAGGTPTAAAIYSSDGTDWTVAAIPAPQPPAIPAIPPLRAVAWNGRQFLAASDRGVLLRSQSGRGWTALGAVRQDGTGNNEILPRINAVAWTGNRFLAAGEDGRIVSSGGVDVAVGVDDDLSVSEDDDPGFALAGLDKEYRFTISNIAILDAMNVQFTYTLPPEVTQSLALAQVEAPDNWTCVLTGGGAGLSCNTGRLAAGTGDAATIGITVAIPADSDSTITHLVEVDPVQINDTQPGNNVLAVVTRIGPRAAPGLPSPDTDFSSRGAFGGLDLMSLLLLALAVALGRASTRRPVTA
jgi:hypothetical protein